MTHAMHRDPAADHQCRIGNSTVEFGRFTYGIERASVIQWGEGSALRIGSFCSLAADITFILGGNHRSDWATTYPFGHIHIEHLGGREIKGHPATNGDIVIGHDVWIATGATIMSGITVGDGAIIAANAHVVKNIGPYEIWGGNPAQKIRDRFTRPVTERLLALQWWALPQEHIRRIAPTLSQAPTVELLDALIAEYAAVPRDKPPLEITPEGRKRPFWKRLFRFRRN